MRFSMEVGGDAQKYQLDYSFNQLLGSLEIKVNDELVKRAVRLFSGPARETFHLDIGEQEKLFVRIEKETQRLFRQRNRVFVNDRLVKTFEGV